MTDTDDRKAVAEIAKFEAETRKANAEADEALLRITGLARFERDSAADAKLNRVLTFAHTITETTATLLISELDNMSRREEGEPLTLVLSSPGGEVIPGLAVYDFLTELRKRGHRLTIVCYGWIASMAGVVFQAGDVRRMGKNAIMLIHEVSGIAYGTASQIEDSMVLTGMLQDRMVEILASRSTMSARQIKTKWKRKDWWLGAQEALTLGFADEVQG